MSYGGAPGPQGGRLPDMTGGPGRRQMIAAGGGTGVGKTRAGDDAAGGRNTVIVGATRPGRVRRCPG
jgi:hypothetical protein